MVSEGVGSQEDELRGSRVGEVEGADRLVETAGADGEVSSRSRKRSG